MPEIAAEHKLDIEAVRREFPILTRSIPNGRPVVYLDSASSAQKPKQVIQKLTEVAENYFANAYRGRYYFGDRDDAELETSRQKIQSLIGAAEKEEIVFTSGTTMSINLVANAWGRKFLKPGDEILLNEMEHHANLVPWQQIAKEMHAQLRFLPLTSDWQLDLSKLDEVLTPKTRMVAVSGMSNVLGTVNPIDKIATSAKAQGALVLVDGAQSVPHQPTDVDASQIDFLAFSGHKLYGPTGVGVLYGRRNLLESMEPFLCGGHMIERVYKDHSSWAELPAKFEAGTLPIVEAIAMGSAVDFVTSIGFDAIREHEHQLLNYAHANLLQIPGLKIYGPAVEHKGSIVSFTIEGLHSEDLAFHLDRNGICTRHGHHCTMPLHDLLGVASTTRASFAIYNTLAEIDALADAIQFARKKMRLA